MPLFQTENGSPGDFSQSVYCLLIVQTEVYCLSVCSRRNKRNLSICKRIKGTKRTCLSFLKLTSISFAICSLYAALTLPQSGTFHRTYRDQGNVASSRFRPVCISKISPGRRTFTDSTLQFYNAIVNYTTTDNKYNINYVE